MQRVKRVLLLLVLLGCAAPTSLDGAAESTLQEESAVSPLLHLPTELRTLALGCLDICDYATFLKTSRTTSSSLRLPDEIASQLVCKGAEEYDGLAEEHPRERRRIKRILSSVHTILRSHFALSTLPVGHGPDTLARHLQQTYTQYASQSRRSIWRCVCMMALLHGSTLRSLMPSLSSPFKETNLEHFQMVLAWTGELDFLDELSRNTKPLYRMIALGAVLNGSESNFTTIQERFPRIIDHYKEILLLAVKYDRIILMTKLFKRFSKQLDGPEGKLRFEDLFVNMCVYGSASAIKALQPYTKFLKSKVLRTGLLLGTAQGNLAAIQPLLEDHEPGGGRQRIGRDLLMEMLADAVRNDQLEIVEYLLVDRRDLNRLLSASAIQEVLGIAVERGLLRIIDRLLGQDGDGRYLVPDRSVISSLENAMAAGQLQVFKHLVAQKDRNPRLANLDLAMNDNYLLQRAAGLGQLTFLRYLLQRDGKGDFVFAGIDPGANGNAALINACQGCWLEVAEELLSMDDAGNLIYGTVKAGAQDNEALIAAVREDCEVLVRLLLERVPGDDGAYRYKYAGVDPAARNQEPLRIAIERRNLGMVRALFQREDTGEYIHPTVQVPRGTLTAMVERGEDRLLNELLLHPICDRQQEVQAALEAARHNNNPTLVRILNT